jgi:hypothetical protein
MSTSYALEKPTTKTELLRRLAKHGIDEDRPGVLHMHYEADDTGPEEDAYLHYRIDADGMVRDLKRTRPCGRAAVAGEVLAQRFDPTYGVLTDKEAA